ncbi:MAG: NRDE family protein [Cytophagaceae bacterium]|nr:NRDE family protein [Cytophagaceae bacterium]
MCVLTYLPTLTGFILTNNRDEHISRPRAIPPRRYCLHNREVYFPKDPRAGGTWLAASRHLTVCLLNGAFAPHFPQPPYRQSRGLVVLDRFDFTGTDEFVKTYPFEGLEPFTLLTFETSGALAINELRWDGKQLSPAEKDPSQAHIWSSVTLYSPAVVQTRQGWFADWQQQYPDFQAEDIWRFHHTGGRGDHKNDLVMERPNGILTFSVMQVEKMGETLRLAYQDLQTREEWRYRVL